MRDNFIPERLKQFFKTEAAGGVILLFAAVVAMIAANSTLSSQYFELLHLKAGPFTVHQWINDALMAVFFFVVGMEIKAELTTGALASFDRAILPVAGAIGGMIIPALIFLAFVGADGEANRGWGIPMATDIAFAVGVVALLGRRVPTSLKVFLLALAIADDLGAVLVIAFFYTDALHTGYLAGAFYFFSRFMRRQSRASTRRFSMSHLGSRPGGVFMSRACMRPLPDAFSDFLFHTRGP